VAFHESPARRDEASLRPPRGTTLLGRVPARLRRGAATARSVYSCCRFYWAGRSLAARAGRPFLRRLRGDLVAGPAPGLAPSPGRSWPRSAAAVPIHAVQTATIADGPAGAEPFARREPGRGGFA